MSRHTRYYGTEDLEVNDYDKLQRFIKMNKMGLINGDDMSHVFKVHHRANPQENKLDWFITVGLGDCDELSDFYINHFDPEDCTAQILFSEIAKFTRPFKIYAFDEEFPVIGENEHTRYAWELDNNEEGKLTITPLSLVKSGPQSEDVSGLDEDDYKEYEERLNNELH